MATTPTSEDAVAEEKNTADLTGSQKQNNASGLLPWFSNFGNRRIEIRTIRDDGNFYTSQGSFFIKPGDVVEFTGNNLDGYDRIQFSAQSDGADNIKTVQASAHLLDFFSFKMPDLGKSVANGGRFWIKLIGSNPELTWVISQSLNYSITDEQEQKEKNKKQQEAIEKEKQSEGGKTKILDNIVDTAIAGAPTVFAKGLDASGKKIVSASGPVSSPAASAGSGSSRETSQQDGAGDNGGEAVDFNQESELGALEQVSTTTDISGGASIISQSGTVEQNTSSAISSGGTSQINSTVTQRGTGTVGATIQAGQQVSSSGIVSASGTQQVSSTVSSGGSSASRETISSTASGSAAVGAQDSVSAEAKITAQESGSGDAQVQGSSSQASSSQSQSTVQNTTQTARSVNVAQTSTAALNFNLPQSGGASSLGAMPPAQSSPSTEKAPVSGAKEDKTAVEKSQTDGDDVSSEKSAPSADSKKQETTEKPERSGQSLPGKGGVDGVEQKKPTAREGASPENNGIEKNKSLPQTSKEGKADEKIQAPSPAIAKMVGDLNKKDKVLDNLRMGANGAHKADPARPSNIDGLKSVGVAGALGQSREDGKNESKEKSEKESGNISQPSKPQPTSQDDDSIPPKSESAPAIPVPQQNQPSSKNDTDANQEDGSGEDSTEPSEADSNLIAQRQSVIESVAKKRNLDKAISEATKAISLAMNSALMAGADVIWIATLGSLGLAAVPGALLADAIAIFKNPIIKFFVNRRLTTPELRAQSQKIAEEIKFSRAVNLNIFALNLVAAIVIIILIVLIASLVNGLCKGLITGITASAVGFGDVCKAASQFAVPVSK